jgi:hypothetical protein
VVKKTGGLRRVILCLMKAHLSSSRLPAQLFLLLGDNCDRMKRSRDELMGFMEEIRLG